MQSTRENSAAGQRTILTQLEYFLRKHLQSGLVCIKASPLSANHHFVFCRFLIAVSVLHFFAVLRPARKGQELLPQSIESETWQLRENAMIIPGSCESGHTD